MREELSELLLRKHAAQPKRTLFEHNILQLQNEFSLQRRELHHLFAFHQAMLRDTGLAAKLGDTRVRLDTRKVVQSFAVLLDIPA